MKVCVLQPDYSTTSVDYKNYDPPRDLSSLLPGVEVDHVFLNKLTTYNQLKQLAKKRYGVSLSLFNGDAIIACIAKCRTGPFDVHDGVMRIVGMHWQYTIDRKRGVAAS